MDADLFYIIQKLNRQWGGSVLVMKKNGSVECGTLLLNAIKHLIDLISTTTYIVITTNAKGYVKLTMKKRPHTITESDLVANSLPVCFKRGDVCKLVCLPFPVDFKTGHLQHRVSEGPVARQMQ